MPSPKVSDLFLLALEVPAERRKAFLRDAGLDEKTRIEVEQLLASHEAAGNFLATGAAPAGLRLILSPPRLEVGHTVENFTIKREIGAGSFATVYLAFDDTLGREVALKVTRNTGDEGRTMAPLEHDNILKVFSEKRLPERDLRLLCMPFVPGSSLERVLAARDGKALDGKTYLARIHAVTGDTIASDPTAAAEQAKIESFSATELLLWLGIKMADALTYAHQKGVLHLDLKPDNILLTSYGRPLLGDFNVSQRSMGEASRNLKGGTLRYMPPEQEALFRGEKKTLDERSDIFALGVVLRQLFELAPENDDIAAILAKCTEPDPDRRFASAADLSAALRHLEESHALESAARPGALLRAQARAPFAFFALAGWLPLPAYHITTTFFLARLNPPSDLAPSFAVLWDGWKLFAVAAVLWTAVALALRQAGKKGRQLAILFPVLLLMLGSLAAWAIPAQFIYRASQGIALPRDSGFHFSRLILPVCLLTIGIAVTWAQLIAGHLLFPSAWAGQPDASQRARKRARLAAKLSLFCQLSLVVLPLAVGLAILLPRVTGLRLPPQLALLCVSGAGAAALGAAFGVFSWVRFFRIFK